ncbi:MAG: hypothetical protein CL902_07585 [Dehalococcoidia bacterium]|nr:hypothetical protein [Dehalococcoidia bacterium]
MAASGRDQFQPRLFPPNQGRTVWYESAEAFREVRSTGLIRALVDGTVCIDFDAYLRESGGIRDHGTKFRIKSENLSNLYTEYEAISI